jgi:hypothetical protein
MTQTLQLELDEQTADRVQRLAAERQITPEELIRDLVAQADEPAPVKDPFLGLLADEPELIEQIVEEAMTARERYPFRAPNG